MSYPVIGLTSYNQENKSHFPITALMRAYIVAITDAGGVPVVIPTGLRSEALQSLFDRLDGVMLTGGGDISIDRYHGEPNPRVMGVDLERDDLEFELIKMASKFGKPYLGICRGCQVVNVAMGGSLYSNISGQLPHAIKHDLDSAAQRKSLAHEVDFDGSSKLSSILGKAKLQVNSLHHQGLKEIAPGLRVTARASDGLVEAVEQPGHPFGVAVQWHPEWLTDQPSARNLFRAFVKAADGG